MPEPKTTPLEDLTVVCEEIFDRWNMDMKPGKLLSALTGRLPNYDARISRIREILEKASD